MSLKIDDNTKHIVCYSGGHSSAIVAIEVARRYGRYCTYLVNNDINPGVEHEDIKRFKKEVAEYLGIKVTYANYKHWDKRDQFDVCTAEGYINRVGVGAVCTHNLKVLPFRRWLKKNAKDKNVVIYYGFDANEKKRIQRRQGILANQGYQTDFPLATWTKRTIKKTEEVGIRPPLTYSVYKHANCLGCIKGGRRHWYVIYCNEPAIWEKAKKMESDVGYAMLTDYETKQPVYLEDLEGLYEKMKNAGVPATERVNPNMFWGAAKRLMSQYEESISKEEGGDKPCECFT